jgi:hypothetical protein
MRGLKIAVCINFFPLQTANVAYFQRKIQLYGFCKYLDGWRSQLIRIIGVMLYCSEDGGFPVGKETCHPRWLVLSANVWTGVTGVFRAKTKQTSGKPCGTAVRPSKCVKVMVLHCERRLIMPVFGFCNTNGNTQILSEGRHDPEPVPSDFQTL